jgi:hypothetical protein
MVWTPSLIVFWITGICLTMASSSFRVSLEVRAAIPQLLSPRYSGLDSKKSALALARLLHGNRPVDVGLRAVHDSHPAVAEGSCVALEHVPGVGTPVHDVELREDPDGALARGVDLTS